MLRIVTEGRALSAFKSNRVGLTILHPVPDCAGAEVTVTHSDGAKEETRFPQLISPSQPVCDDAWDVRGLHGVATCGAP